MSDPALGHPRAPWTPGPPDRSGPPDPAGPRDLGPIDAEIRVLVSQSEQARQAWERAESRLSVLRHQRAILAEQLAGAARMAPTVAGAAAPGGPAGAQPPAGWATAPQQGGWPPAPPAPTPESSTRTVQNVLFILGGLLLGTAAIVFTAVAWASYGVGGRAAILAVVTALSLAAPLVALRRSLTATAETFAGVGLLLVLLDGYAAWYVDLFGVASRPGSQYAGLVALITAVVAAGYGAATRLVGPRFVALLAVQPVLPLLAIQFEPSVTAWSLIATGVCAVNLLVVARYREQVATALLIRGLGGEEHLVPTSHELGGEEYLVPTTRGLGGEEHLVPTTRGLGGEEHLVRSAGPARQPVPQPAAPQPAAAMRTMAWIFGTTALAIAALSAITAEAQARTGGAAAFAGLVVLAVAAALAAGATLSRRNDLRTLAGFVGVLAVATAGSVFAGVVWSGNILLAVTAVVSVVAVGAHATGRALRSAGTAGGAPLTPPAGAAPGNDTPAAPGNGGPAARGNDATADDSTARPGDGAVRPGGAATMVPVNAVRNGISAGAFSVLGAIALALFGFTSVAAIDTLTRVTPLWQALLTSSPAFDAGLLAAIALAGAAGATIVARQARPAVLATAAVFAVLALPDCAALAWWAPSAVDLSAAAVLLVLAILHRPVRTVAGPAVAAGILAGYAVLASLARPGNTAAVLGGVVLVGLVGGALGRRPGAHRGVAGLSLAAGMLALPAMVGAALIAAERAGTLDLAPWWTARWTLGAVALVLGGLFAVRRWWPDLTWYAFAATLLSAGCWPAVLAATGGEPVGVYGGLGLLLVAAALLAPGPSTVDATATATGRTDPPAVAAIAGAAVAAVPGALLLATGVLPAVVAVLGSPYSWLDAIWSGHPAGVGLAPTGVRVPTGATAVAAWSLALLALVSATAAYALTRRISAALGGLAIGGPTAVIVGCVAAALPWPAVPAVTLLLGLGFMAVAGIAPVGPVRSAIATAQGLLYLGAGLAGTLTVRWSTLAGLASIVVVAAVVGAVGRAIGWRIVAWLGAAAAALGLAVAAGLAADLAVRDTGFVVLGTAIAVLAASAVLRSARPAEATALAAAAHASAVVALLLTLGWIGHTALVSAVWGLAVGLRALWPRTAASSRAALAATGAAWELLAWWLLLADRGVTEVEAYTLPLAAVALLAGWAGLRARPELRSWVSYGPALAAAFLPSLAVVLSGSESPWRRLILGVAALLVVIAGSVRRRQAPVVAGGIVLIIVALHEIALAWDLMPRWIPLAIGGLLLVGLAITYERRRRDLARLRAAVSRMT